MMRHLINKHYDTHGGFSVILTNVSSHIQAPVSLKDETMKLTRQNKDGKVVFESTQDVIVWLEYIKLQHPLTRHECERAYPFEGNMVEVYTDHVIKDRYQEMIDWLKSDEVEGGE